MKTAGSTTLSTTNDIIAREEYNRTMGLTSTYISPKERKLKKLSALTGKDEKYWSKLKSKQLGAVLKGEEQRLFKLSAII